MTRVVAVGVGAAILSTLVAIAHVVWTRSADSQTVHYSWPVKWALTLALESPDLPVGSRFTTVTVTSVSGDERWTVTGEVELPGTEDRRLITSFGAIVSNQCPEVAERRCWAMDALTLGAVPATIPASPSDVPTIERGLPLALAISSAPGEPALAAGLPAPPAQSAENESNAAPEEDEDLAFILSESLGGPSDDPPLTSFDPPRTARPRHDSALIRDIQRGLVSLGYDPGPVDGIPGERTNAAVEAFRIREGLASAPVGRDLLTEITRRIAYGEPVPLQVPFGLQQQPEPEGHLSACRTINPKDRECDR